MRGLPHHPAGGGYGERMPRRTAVVLAFAACVVSGCGGDEEPPSASTGTRAGTACVEQWERTADSVLGLDQASSPSGLSSRWTAVIASIDYYLNSEPPADCQDLVEAQDTEIASLRQFSEKLRPYDMSYQLEQVRPGIDLYLHDPLPVPTRNENGALVRPPTKDAVLAAFRTLTAGAGSADSDLDAGWSQMATVDLDDVDALRSAVTDLDDLAQSSSSWRECEAALQVLVAAIRAQEGGLTASTP